MSTSDITYNSDNGRLSFTLPSNQAFYDNNSKEVNVFLYYEDIIPLQEKLKEIQKDLDCHRIDLLKEQIRVKEAEISKIRKRIYDT